MFISRKALEVVNELFVFFFVHSGFTSGEIFQLFVGVRAVIFAHDSLNGLGKELVVASKLFSELIFVGGDTAESLLDGGDRLDRVRERETEVTEHGRVGQITLESGDRELGREMGEEGNG